MVCVKGSDGDGLLPVIYMDNTFPKSTACAQWLLWAYATEEQIRFSFPKHPSTLFFLKSESEEGSYSPLWKKTYTFEEDFFRFQALQF